MLDQASTIGTVAREAGVGVETIRYYQRIGLVNEPPRSRGTVRRYPADTAERIRFIKRAQDLGFSLQEIAELLRLNDGVHCRDARALAAKKFAAIETRIRDLTKVRRSLRQLIGACDAGDKRECCPIIESLNSVQPRHAFRRQPAMRH